jgi:hypothetical protein
VHLADGARLQPGSAHLAPGAVSRLQFGIEGDER